MEDLVSCRSALDLGLDLLDIGLGREIGVEQGDMLVGQGLGLPLGKPALRSGA